MAWRGRARVTADDDLDQEGSANAPPAPSCPSRRRNPRPPRFRRVRVAYPDPNARAPNADASSHGDPASSAYVDAGSYVDAYANPTPSAYMDANSHLDSNANSSAYMDANSHLDAGADSRSHCDAYANACCLRSREVLRRQDDPHQGRRTRAASAISNRLRRRRHGAA